MIWSLLLWSVWQESHIKTNTIALQLKLLTDRWRKCQLKVSLNGRRLRSLTRPHPCCCCCFCCCCCCCCCSHCRCLTKWPKTPITNTPTPSSSNKWGNWFLEVELVHLRSTCRQIRRRGALMKLIVIQQLYRTLVPIAEKNKILVRGVG